MSEPITTHTTGEGALSNATQTPSDDTAALEAQLKAAKAAQAEARARRDALANAAELRRELARAELAVKDDVEIAKLIEKHGALGVKIDVINTELGAIVVTRPSALKYKRFQDADKSKYEDVLAFVKPCVLYPSSARFDEILDELAGTLSVVANTVVDLAGHQHKEQQKK